MFRNPTTDLIVVLVIVLLIFGPKRLPALGKRLGHGMREFKDVDHRRAQGRRRAEPRRRPTIAGRQRPSARRSGAALRPSASPLRSDPQRRS